MSEQMIFPLHIDTGILKSDNPTAMTTTFPAPSARRARIAVSTSQGTYVFQTDEITRLQASSNYTFMYFVNRKPLLISKVLKTYEELLGPLGFIRTHQSHLVNPQYIRFMDRQGALEMHDATRVEVSRSKRKVVLHALKNVCLASAAHDQHPMAMTGSSNAA